MFARPLVALALLCAPAGAALLRGSSAYAPRTRGAAQASAAARPSAAALALEDDLLRLCSSEAAPRADVEAAVAGLVADGGPVSSPALSPQIEGEWRLLHTSSSDFDLSNPLGRRVDGSTPGLEGLLAALTGGDAAALPSSSPIQRAVTNAFSVSQRLSRLGDGGRVEQRVETPLGVLHLNARASVTPAEPARVRFAFDEGYFASAAGLRLPYPVPFRLLGKEAEGYLDTSYLSERVRVSRGNKGTTFVLARA